MTLTTFRAIAWNEPAYLRMGFETLQPGDEDPRLAAILARDVGAGLPADRRCTMRLALGPATGLIRLRRSQPRDEDRVVEIWRNAIDATHDFLKRDDRVAIDAEVQALLPQMPL